MTNSISKLLTVTTLVIAATACDVEEVRPAEDVPTISKEEAAALGGKADGIDFCDWLGWYGDGICDAWCPEPDPDCEDLGGPTCADLGGQCLSSPIDVTFGANCEADFGMATADGSCGDVINLSCCVPDDIADGDGEGGEDDGGEPSCEAIGGQCLSSPIDVTFPADCEADFEMLDGDGSCGDIINLSCCVPADGDDDDDDDDDDGNACEDAGGQCLSSPIDVTFGANCEADFGLGFIDAECPFFNQSCCG